MTTRSHFSEPAKSSPGWLIFAWLFVGLPMAWGVIQTILKSLALFQ